MTRLYEFVRRGLHLFATPGLNRRAPAPQARVRLGNPHAFTSMGHG